MATNVLDSNHGLEASLTVVCDKTGTADAIYKRSIHFRWTPLLLKRRLLQLSSIEHYRASSFNLPSLTYE